jgi:hypothetical protein
MSKRAVIENRLLVPDEATGKLVSACCSRRAFLGRSFAAGLAAAATAAASRVAFGGDAPTVERPAYPGEALAGYGKAKRAIFVYLQGGPSHIDTFDPKPGRETGGPFKPVRTAIPGVVLGERLPKLAGQMEKFALIRSMTSKEGNHSRARTLVHTAYAPEATVTHPSYGAALSENVGKKDFDLPNFVSVGPQQDSAGFLGVQHGPFVIDNPTRPIQNLDYNPAVGGDRVARRLDLLAGLQSDFAATHGKETTEGRDDMFKKAKRLVDTKLRDAFDLSKESDATRNAYGRTETGAACLMARRLAETGVSCVEVVVNGWDTHDDNFDKVGALCDALDPALATLLADLQSRGLLESTLVTCFGEFGRTPRINPRGGRDHWARSWSALVAGGGVIGGQVIGATDEDGMAPKERPVQVSDLYASFWHSFGVDPWKEYTANDRPITLVPKEGRIVRELFV